MINWASGKNLPLPSLYAIPRTKFYCYLLFRLPAHEIFVFWSFSTLWYVYWTLKSEKNLAKPLFLLQSQKISLQKLQVWRRTISKNLEYLTRWRQMRRIVVGDNSPIIFTILIICFIIPFLQSNTSLNSTRILHQKRKAEQIIWRLLSFWGFLKGKKQLFLDGQNFRNVLGDTYFKVQDC